MPVIVDLTNLEKTCEFAKLALYMDTLDGKRGIHVVVVYLVLRKCRVPWSLRLWQGDPY